jgi:hypothetical protein
MNSKSTYPICEIELAIMQSRKPSKKQPGVPMPRGIRAFSSSLPERSKCLMKQMLAALREAELAAWQASGGDFLSGMHQPA